jgi:hypothetical protein
MPESLHLRHPANAYRPEFSKKLLISTPWMVTKDPALPEVNRPIKPASFALMIVSPRRYPVSPSECPSKYRLKTTQSLSLRDLKNEAGWLVMSWSCKQF